MAAGLEATGVRVENSTGFFDTLIVHVPGRALNIHEVSESHGYNLRHIDKDRVGVTCDELTTAEDVSALLEIISGAKGRMLSLTPEIPPAFRRASAFLTQEVFQRFHTEHELLRYLNRLAAKDLTLCDTMSGWTRVAAFFLLQMVAFVLLLRLLRSGGDKRGP